MPAIYRIALALCLATWSANACAQAPAATQAAHDRPSGDDETRRAVAAPPVPAERSVGVNRNGDDVTVTALPPYRASGSTWPYQDLTVDRTRYGTPLAPLTPIVGNDAFFTPFIRETYLAAGHKGGLQTALFLGQVRGPPAADQGNRNYTGLQTYMSATSALGGTDMTMSAARGQVFGFSPLAVLYPGATNILNVTGGEVNVQVSRGASVAYKSGLQIVGMSDDAVHGSIYDAALSVSGQQRSIGFRYGILFSAANGTSGITDGGTLVGVKDAPALENGVDLSGGLFSGNAFASRNFAVDGVGNVQARSISGASQRLEGTTYASLPICDEAHSGTLAYVIDAATAVTRWHQAISAGGGSHRTFVACLGSGWIAI